MLKRITVGLLFSTLTFATTSGVAGYIKGVEDTLNFLQAEINSQVPDSDYWLVLDVTNLKNWQVISVANLIYDKFGFYPLWIYDINTYQKYLLLESKDYPEDIARNIYAYKKIYPRGKYLVIKVENPEIFAKVTNIGICSLPKAEIGKGGILSNLQRAINIADEMGEEELKYFIKQCKERVKRYIQMKSGDIK
jgi:hypothetical protein